MPLDPSRRGVEKTLLIGLAAFAMTVSPTCSRENAGSKAGDLAGRLEKLRAMPYLDFTEEELDPAEAGVVRHDPERLF